MEDNVLSCSQAYRCFLATNMSILLSFSLLSISYFLKKFIEKSWECHNHKPQPTPDRLTPKRKRKGTKINACQIKKQMQEKHVDPALSSPSELITVLIRTEKLTLLNSIISL